MASYVESFSMVWRFMIIPILCYMDVQDLLVISILVFFRPSVLFEMEISPTVSPKTSQHLATVMESGSAEPDTTDWMK